MAETQVVINPDVAKAAEDPYVQHVAQHLRLLMGIPLSQKLNANPYDPAKHDIHGVVAWKKEIESHLKETGKWSSYNPPRGFMTEVIEIADDLLDQEGVIADDR